MRRYRLTAGTFCLQKTRRHTPGFTAPRLGALGAVRRGPNQTVDTLAWLSLPYLLVSTAVVL